MKELMKRAYFRYRSGARIAAGKVDIRSRFGPGCIVRELCSIRSARLGSDVFVNRGAVLHDVEIGSFSSIGPYAVLGPNEHLLDTYSTCSQLYAGEVADRLSEHNREYTHIGPDVWVGANAVVRKGVTIGVGAVVAAGAMVVRDVEPYAIVGGVPAGLIRMRFQNCLVAELEASEWWRFDRSSVYAAARVASEATGEQSVHAFLAALHVR